jgi:hypothetical protein
MPTLTPRNGRQHRVALIHRAQGWRARARRDEGGQTMPVVLGVILILSLGTIVLVQNTFQQFPIVSKDVIQHQAYRAMESGLDEYLYALNADADFAVCNATFVNGSGTVVGTSPLTSSSSVCSGLSFGTWTSVPGSASANGSPGWFLIDNPKVSTTTGLLSVDIVGAAGYPNQYNYQTAVLTLQPLNSFLLNVLWINYNQIDPPVVAQYNNVSAPTCQYYWSNGNSLNNNCENVDFITGDSFNGSLFINDSIFLCGSPSFGQVETADTNQNWVQDNGCSGTPTYSSWKNNVPIEPIPTDNSSLQDNAEVGGCAYQGPTTIVLNGSTMNVTSPDTPTGPPSGAPTGSSSNDALNDPANTGNVCMPSSSGGSVAIPSNGVVYVENCGPSYLTTCNSNNTPLSGAGETGVGGNTVGDAIIGSENNIVIDGNLCYADTMSSGNCTTTTPSAPSTDVLGLVALNYVEINHPVNSRGNNVSTCSPSTSPTSGAVTCDLSNPILDAVILALNHSFIVNNYNTGNTLGTITLQGTIDEDWRGPVGTFGSNNTGYLKNYLYDPRLLYLSPPYYLNPGTSQWGLASFTVKAGACTTPSGAYPTACTSFP